MIETWVLILFINLHDNINTVTVSNFSSQQECVDAGNAAESKKTYSLQVDYVCVKQNKAKG